MAEVDVSGGVFVDFLEFDVDITVVVVNFFGHGRGDRDSVAHFVESSDLLFVEFDFVSFGMRDVFDFSNLFKVLNIFLLVKLGLGHD